MVCDQSWWLAVSMDCLKWVWYRFQQIAYIVRLQILGTVQGVEEGGLQPVQDAVLTRSKFVSIYNVELQSNQEHK